MPVASEVHGVDRETSQRPHFTGDGHTKPILNEVKDQVSTGSLDW